MLHIKSKLADPVMVHLTSPGARSVRISEVVESGSPLQGIQQLLQQHGQASTGFVTGAGEAGADEWRTHAVPPDEVCLAWQQTPHSHAKC